jgi:hypothetical protein
VAEPLTRNDGLAVSAVRARARISSALMASTPLLVGVGEVVSEGTAVDEGLVPGPEQPVPSIATATSTGKRASERILFLPGATVS